MDAQLTELRLENLKNDSRNGSVVNKKEFAEGDSQHHPEYMTLHC